MNREDIIRSICHVPTDFGYPIHFTESDRQTISQNMKKLELEDQNRPPY
ncbi:MAG: hypothetical protein ACFE9L_15960 [Candidatus Hodarchaeota archaeon]